jgi:hypothetical protein
MSAPRISLFRIVQARLSLKISCKIGDIFNVIDPGELIGRPAPAPHSAFVETLVNIAASVAAVVVTGAIFARAVICAVLP